MTQMGPRIDLGLLDHIFRRLVLKAPLRASPSYLVARVNLAAALASEAKWPEAQEAVDEALRLDPNNATGRELEQAIREAQNGR